MARLIWGPKHDVPDPSPAGYNVGPTPTVNGTLKPHADVFRSEPNAEVRLFQYSTDGEWGVQVTVTVESRAPSLAAAKRKARALVNKYASRETNR